MSLFRPSRVFASIELDRVSLVRVTGTRHVEAREERVFRGAPDPDPTQGVLNEVTRTLAEPGWRGTRRHVVVSDRLVHYLLTPRPHGIRSSTELKQAIDTRFEQLFEAPAADWIVSADLRPLARHFVACAMPRRLADAVQAAFSTAGACASIRPFLAAELNRRGRRLPRECWYAAASRDCVALARIAGGECRRLRVLPALSPDAAHVAGLIDRERLVGGDEPNGAAILTSGVLHGDPRAQDLKRIDQPKWRGKSKAWCSTFRVALSEVWA